jgi:hypothetical protein
MDHGYAIQATVGFILPGVKTPRYKIDRGYAPSIQIKHVRQDRLKKHLKGAL